MIQNLCFLLAIHGAFGQNFIEPSTAPSSSFVPTSSSDAAPSSVAPIPTPVTDEESSNGLEDAVRIVFFICFILAAVVCARLIRKRPGEEGRYWFADPNRGPRREVRRTMVARRQQQRQDNTQGLTEDERNNERYEKFVSRFHFQTVLADKSNITADSLRSLSLVRPGQDDEEVAPENGSKQTSLSARLSSWRSPSAKDECCICLMSYNVGETICAPMTTACNHVFHEGCILEWLKTKDVCPLCRIAVFND